MYIQQQGQMLIKSPKLGNLCFDYFIHCKLKVFVNSVSPLTFFSFQGVDSHFNIQIGMWQAMDRWRFSTSGDAGVGFFKGAGDFSSKTITLFRCLKSKDHQKTINFPLFLIRRKIHFSLFQPVRFWLFPLYVFQTKWHKSGVAATSWNQNDFWQQFAGPWGLGTFPCNPPNQRNVALMT